MQSNYLVLAAAALWLLSNRRLKFHSLYAKTCHALHIEAAPRQEKTGHSFLNRIKYFSK